MDQEFQMYGLNYNTESHYKIFKETENKLTTFLYLTLTMSYFLFIWKGMSIPAVPELMDKKMDMQVQNYVLGRRWKL